MLAFPLSSGVELQSGVIPEDSYSIAALVRFDEITGYRRIVDISSASADQGLYERSGQLYYWPITGGSVTPPPFEINKYVHVVLTRDAATKRMVAYADGVEQLAFDDTTDAGVFARQPGALLQGRPDHHGRGVGRRGGPHPGLRGRADRGGGGRHQRQEARRPAGAGSART